MKDYRKYSFWLDTCGDDLTPRPRLNGSIDVDIAILGAGYTGLWTAYYLLGKDPSLKIAIIEREIAGFGASGRNGGWCYPGFPVGYGSLARRFGQPAAVAVSNAMHETVAEVGRVIAAEGIDANWHEGGTLQIARGPNQLPSIEGYYREMVKLGLGDHYELLDKTELASRVRITNALAAVRTPDGAAIQPAKLARGLARAVERRGATIYEQTPVTDYVSGTRPRLITPYGDVRAKTLMLAGEAYLSQLPKLHRALVPMYSLIVVTEPLSEAQWAEIGWANRELIGSARYSVDYLQRTTDGRIMFGGRGAPYVWDSQITDEQDQHGPTHAMLETMLRDWFPAASAARITHTWGGPLGMPRDWMPTTSFNPKTGIARAGGYTGSGVSTTNLFGRTMTDLILGETSALTKLPMVNYQSPKWEPEPLRFLGIRFAQEGLLKVDKKAEDTGVPPTGKTLAERLGAR